MSTPVYGLFEAWGIEIECMIVDSKSLDVLPIVDEVLFEAGGKNEWVEDVDDGEIGWSNELVGHVLELKNVVPAPTMGALVEPFERSIKKLNRMLTQRSARLLPGGMHPWMEPARETCIWPHESGPIYRAYDALFDCRRHGWSNLQSVHLNLPFKDDAEFGRLMAAVRLVLPLIPAIAASSPVVEGRRTALLDNRLAMYAENSKRVPAMTGAVIPEPIYEIQRYRAEVLAPITQQLREVGADPMLSGQEWTNARGAIARFDRMAIEVRLIDAQECPIADLAVAAAVGGAIQGLVEERWSDYAAQRAWSVAPLRDQLDRCIESGSATAVQPELAAMFGADPGQPSTAGALWHRLVEGTFAGPVALEIHAANVVRSGNLAERIARAVGQEPSREVLVEVYRELADCLAAGRPFRT